MKSRCVRIGNSDSSNHSQTTQFEMEKLDQVNPIRLIYPTPLINYFKVILNIGFLLCLIPFRLVEAHSRFLIVTNKFQQVACGIVQFIVLYRFISAFWTEDFHSHNETEHNSDTNSNFLSRVGLNLVGHVIDVVYGVGFVYTFWTKKTRICKMLSLMENLDIVDNRKKNTGLKIKALALAMCGLLAIFAITDTRLHGSTLTNGNLWKYMEELYQESRQCYLFQDPRTQIQGIFWTILSIFFTGLHFITGLPHFFLVHVFELFLVLTAICLRHLMKDFLRFCKKSSADINLVLAQYEILKELVKTGNGIIRVLLLCCVGVSLPFYTFWAAVVYFEEHVIIHFFIHFGTFFILLTVAADFNAKAGKFYVWIASTENLEQISANRLVSLNMDMNSNQLAIRGSGFFTITYRFFGTILSVLSTYTVIIIQFQVTRQGFGFGNLGNLV